MERNRKLINGNCIPKTWEINQWIDEWKAKIWENKTRILNTDKLKPGI